MKEKFMIEEMGLTKNKDLDAGSDIQKQYEIFQNAGYIEYNEK